LFSTQRARPWHYELKRTGQARSRNQCIWRPRRRQDSAEDTGLKPVVRRRSTWLVLRPAQYRASRTLPGLIQGPSARSSGQPGDNRPVAAASRADVGALTVREVCGGRWGGGTAAEGLVLLLPEEDPSPHPQPLPSAGPSLPRSTSLRSRTSSSRDGGAPGVAMAAQESVDLGDAWRGLGAFVLLYPRESSPSRPWRRTESRSGSRGRCPSPSPLSPRPPPLPSPPSLSPSPLSSPSSQADPLHPRASFGLSCSETR